MATAESNSPSPKKLRSKAGLSCANSISTILPAICIICKKKEIFVTMKQKRVREKLSKAQTLHCGLLRRAAETKGDEDILLHIRVKDCVAIEVRYHFSCYRNYTRFLSRPQEKSNVEKGQSARQPYVTSYEHFCKEVILERIVQGKEVLRMTRLTQMFHNYVTKYEAADASSYRSFQLKQRLEKDFPEITFHSPSQKSASTFVYLETIPTSSLVERLQFSSTSETFSSSEADDPLTQERKEGPQDTNGEIMRVLYSAGLIVKSVLADVPDMNCEWPPTSENFDIRSAANLVPVELFNLLAWIIGVSEEPTIEKVTVTDAQELKLLSICQDIVYLASSGGKQTPKSLALGLTVRHLTGSSGLVKMLSKFGHCASSSTILRLETGLAQLQLSSGDTIPKGFSKRVPTVMVWDNIDFREETLTGAGTTHHTNGIMLQSSTSSSASVRVKNINRRNRSLKTQPQGELQPYYLQQKQGPKNIGQGVEVTEANARLQIKSALTSDFAYIITKFAETSSESFSIPSWTGFNKRTQRAAYLPQSAIYYLPVIEASPTEMSTVNEILKKSIQMADMLELRNMVVVFDQAIYAKAQMIRWKDELLRERLIIRLGEFHTAMAFLGILGKRFYGAGLDDILIESNVVAEGSLNGVLSGKHYNRSIRAHKLLFEALQRLRFQSFLDSLPQDEMINYRIKIVCCADSYPQDTHRISQSNEMMALYEKYNAFIQQNAENQTFAFWSTYLDMVQLLLVFIRGTRESNWDMHLAAVRLMLKWYFAYDRVNYARYLPIYWMEMSALPETHPHFHEEMTAVGEWTVQRQEDNLFASIACDQAIEQTVNRDSKTKGGIIGKTMAPGAVQRWILSQPERAAIVRQCESLAGITDDDPTSKVLGKSQMKVDEQAVRSIMSTVQSMINPFDQSHDGLVCLSSGVVASQRVAEDLLTASDKGETVVREYLKERLMHTSEDVFKPIKAMRLKTFSDNMPKATHTKSGKEIMLQHDRALFARLLVIGQNRNMDLREILSYSLGPVSYPLSSLDGSLAKTTKSALLHLLETKAGNCLATSIPPGGVLLLDGMAVLQTMNRVPETFGGFADVVLKHIFNLAVQHSFKRIDFVADTYPTISIKNAERSRRAERGSQTISIYSKNQKTPMQWKKFMSSGVNKENVTQFLFSAWSEVDYSNAPQDLDILITHGQTCHLLSVKNKEVSISEVDELACDHEEADTRLILHAKHASASYETVVVRSPDTDVAVIALSHLQDIPSNLYFLTGVKNKTRMINLKGTEARLTPAVCKGLPGLHAFTGCDSTSAFYGKGKKIAFDLYSNNINFVEAFTNLGKDFNTNDTDLQVFEKFVSELYGQKKVVSVNEARYNIFCTSGAREQSMPPTLDALTLHVKRANYQAKIHRSALTQWIRAPSPSGHGWELKDGDLTIKWMTQDPAPESMLLFITCKCKSSKCESKRCSCRAANMSCTDTCLCNDCQNKVDTRKDSSSSDDDDDEQ